MFDKTIKQIEERINTLGFRLIGCTDKEERRKIKEQIKGLKVDKKAIRAQTST